MRIITNIFEYCAKEVPGWNTISISGYHIREDFHQPQTARPGRRSRAKFRARSPLRWLHSSPHPLHRDRTPEAAKYPPGKQSHSEEDCSKRQKSAGQSPAPAIHRLADLLPVIVDSIPVGHHHIVK